jgi:site-specific DNA recombinase
MLASRRVARLKAKATAATAARETIATKAAGYIRVSTEDQAAHGHGLEGQEKAIRAFAESQGYELVTVESDPGVSGATRPADRPGFGRMIEMAAAGAFSVVLVWKFDRLARQIVYAVTTVNDLAGQGVALRSVTEPVDSSTPMGRTMFALLSGMAEQERENITHRTASGRVMKATKGGFAGGRAPYGYRKNLEGGLEIEPREAATVKRIYKRRASGSTLQLIADELNADRVPSPGGANWSVRRVAYILDNPKYGGNVEYLFRWSGAETHVLAAGSHQAII